MSETSTIAEGLKLLDYLAAGLNKEDPVIKRIFYNDDDGEKSGAVATEMGDAADCIRYYTQTDDVRNHEGKSLELLSILFANQKRRLYENDNILLRRLLALTERGGDVIWGNALNLKHVVEKYFGGGIACYIAENTDDIERNLLPDGDFEVEAEHRPWRLNEEAEIAHEARFSLLRGLLLPAGAEGSCGQEVAHDYAPGLYTLHFMLRGKCEVVIRRGGQYWNAREQNYGKNGIDILSWESKEHCNAFESPRGKDGNYAWVNRSCLIVLPSGVTSLDIQFRSAKEDGVPVQAHIDHIRLFKKPMNPSYTLIAQHRGDTQHSKTLHLNGKNVDIVGQPNSENPDNERFYDHAFLVGAFVPTQIKKFMSVLDIVRPCGIQIFVEFIEQTEEEPDGGDEDE